MNNNPDNLTEKESNSKDHLIKSGLLSSKNLFGNHREIHIEHLGEIYSLRMTRNGKLILTK